MEQYRLVSDRHDDETKPEAVNKYYYDENEYPGNRTEFHQHVQMFRRVYGYSNVIQDMEILEKYFERTLWS